MAVRHLTIFTQREGQGKLDFLISQLQNFIHDFSPGGARFSWEKAEELKKVITDSSLLMLEEAVAQNKERFSLAYYEQLEKASPNHFCLFDFPAANLPDNLYGPGDRQSVSCLWWMKLPINGFSPTW